MRIMPSFGRQQHHIFDGTSGLTEQDGPAAAASQQDTGAEPSVTRQASFDAGARDSTTVGTSDRGPRADSRAPPGDGHQAPAQQEHAVQDHRDRRFEECGRCGQRFRGIAKNRRQHLKRHVASKHGGARFRCGHPECGCSYNRVDNLHDHERKTHGFVLPLQGGGGGGGGRARPGPSAGAQAVSYGGGSEVVAELAAGDVELRGTGGLSRAVAPGAAPEAEGSAPETGQTSGMVETHLAVFDYPISTEEGLGWRPGGDHGFLDARRTTCISEEEWDEIIAGVSGGHEEESGVADAGHEADNSEDGLSMGLGLAPRPLHLPCASWRV
ncbi:putative zinc finger protein [Diaporthe ampelina]|uniref:Putative zinc finger protein n=1 Tax=Diaporthe ampelina TaxID=1214573 RepID=A0A0G2F7F5_9PEZI|nr:putative zinc finger protein [Diaporthe ampelina]